MNSHTIGLISVVPCVVGTIPYLYRTWKRQIGPYITSWSLWAFIGLALLLTYKSAGAGDSIWPAVFGFINPMIVALILFSQREKWARLDTWDYACIICGAISLALWAWVRNDRDFAQYALYLALFADFCAAGRTIVGVWRSPESDRPFAWVTFALGVFISIFAIRKENLDFEHLVYPIYMTLGSLTVAMPLALYRLRRRVPLKEWI